MDVLLEMMAGPIGGCVNQLLEADVHRPGSFCLFGRERCRGYHRGLSLVYIALFQIGLQISVVSMVLWSVELCLMFTVT